MKKKARAEGPRRTRRTVAAALKAAGMSQEDLTLLLYPRVAEAAARAAKREISRARKEANRNMRAEKAAHLAAALQKTKTR